MIKQYVFRCDADEKNGLGHLIRSINLARVLIKNNNKIKCLFYGDYNVFAKNLLTKYSIPFVTNNKNVLKDSYLIIDNYFVTQDEIKEFKRIVKKLIKIDDFNDLNLIDFDLVVNFRVRAEEFQYRTKRVCLGVKYLAIKPELKNIRKRNMMKEIEDYHTILILIGSFDHHNITSKLIYILDEILQNKKIHLVNFKKKYFDLKNNTIKCLPMTDAIENYYSDVDFIITGGGLSKYEAGYCCIPNASFSQNEGQYEDTKILASEGLTFDLGMANNFDTEQIKIKMMDSICLESRKDIFNSSKKKYITESAENLAKEIMRI